MDDIARGLIRILLRTSLRGESDLFKKEIYEIRCQHSHRYVSLYNHVVVAVNRSAHQFCVPNEIAVFHLC